MMGRQEYQPQLFSSINLETLIPKKHLLRKIDKVLDLSFVRNIAKNLYCQDNGRPSVDPELYVRMVILTFLYNIASDRKLCEEVGFNLAYRWFCRLNLEDKVPDHSSMTKIRDRLGEATFREIFNRVLEQCVENGLVEAQELMMDATLVRANSSVGSLINKEEFEKEVDKSKLKRVKGKKYSNDTHISYTDPEARLAGKAGESKKLYYKVHNSMDPLARVIIDTTVTDGAKSEGKLFFKHLDNIESNFNYKLDVVTADRGYGYGENLKELKNRDLKSFVPNFHSNVGGRFEKQGFVYNKKSQQMRCPKGFLMEEKTPPSLQAILRLFRLKSTTCRPCSHSTQCFPKGSKHYRKSVSLHSQRDLQEEVKFREQTVEFKEKMRERMWKLEGLFAEAKNFHGLGRARYRGRAKVQIQAYMIATVQNLKRLVTMDLLGLYLYILQFFSRKLKYNIFAKNKKIVFLTK